MKKLAKLGLVLSLLATSILPIFSQNNVETASAAVLWMGTQTGYTKASDVKYVTKGKYVLNWGAREEDCVFLTSYANNFYTGSYTYEQLSLKAATSPTSSVWGSDLYKALNNLVKSKQTTETTYQGTRDLYRYTDCVNSNSEYISSFYSGDQISGKWDSGATWNREHTWPNSKGDANGNGENDIMMLRPTAKSENGSRGNKAYGESGGYYNPTSEGQDLRGDCARIILYVYTRWTSESGKNSLWGSSHVIESKSVLLKWMQEDPVDTWEMGRNDATQAITGTRNVYVDYPEYAWLLFGEKIPTNMVTPSGIASNGTATPDIPVNPDPNPPVNPDPETPPQVGDPSCTHRYGEWFVLVPATKESAGLQAHFCRYCGHEEQESIPALTDSDDILNSENNGLFINPLEGLTAGCEASIGVSVVGMSLMTVGFVLLKGKKEDE